MKYPEYAGLSYAEASKKATDVLNMAAETGLWFPIVDRLAELKGIMMRELERDIRTFPQDALDEQLKRSIVA